MGWKLIIGIAAPLTALFALVPAQFASFNSQTPVDARNAVAHPVVLELFTSEGCSSCPPADALLKRLDDAGRAGDTDVIAIEEHVDYWNHLGWTDPFSSHDWADRQERYARAFQHDGVYTPQLVVNGRSDLVGSSERQVLQRISEESKFSDVAIRISSMNILPKSAELTIAIEPSTANSDSADLWLAVTERGLSSRVLRGENEGRNLAHAAVLRSLMRVRMARADSTRITAAVSLDPAWKRENLRVVVFMQEPKSLHILGATASAIPH